MMRLRRIRFKPHASYAWRQRFFYAELIAKGARVDLTSDGWWEVVWR
jgi:hypothetical protein